MSGTFCAKSPTYDQILEFDRQLRDFAVPSHLSLDTTMNNHDSPESPDMVMQRVWAFVLRENGEHGYMFFGVRC